MHLINVALFVAMFLLASHLSGSLHAYLDPGTGSVALQLIIGSVVAALVTIRLYWDRLKTFVRRTPPARDAASEEH